jgi:hypothetical protein
VFWSARLRVWLPGQFPRWPRVGPRGRGGACCLLLEAFCCVLRGVGGQAAFVVGVVAPSCPEQGSLAGAGGVAGAPWRSAVVLLRSSRAALALGRGCVCGGPAACWGRVGGFVGGRRRPFGVRRFEFTPPLGRGPSSPPPGRGRGASEGEWWYGCALAPPGWAGPLVTRVECQFLVFFLPSLPSSLPPLAFANLLT